MKKNEKISMSMPLPSVAMKVFIEKCLDDDEFLVRAMENPIWALRSCGAEVDEKSMIREDFTNFFGAVSRLKDLLKEKSHDEITFEGIFGKPAEIYGSAIMSMMNQGYNKDWDNRDALVQKHASFAVSKNFFAQLKINIQGRKTMDRLALIDKQAIINIKATTEIDWVGAETKSSETNAGMKTEWNLAQAHTEKRSEEYHDQKFEKDRVGFQPPEDMLRGPLVSPREIEIIAARLDAFTQIVKGTKG